MIAQGLLLFVVTKTSTKEGDDQAAFEFRRKVLKGSFYIISNIREAKALAITNNVKRIHKRGVTQIIQKLIVSLDESKVADLNSFLFLFFFDPYPQTVS